MTYYSEIAKGFIRNETFQNKWKSKTGDPSGWAGQGPLSSRSGTLRMSYNDQGLWSYERFLMAVRLDDGSILINADNGPTMNTRMHQRALRGAALGSVEIRSALVPFSAIRAASITYFKNIHIIATTPDRELPYWYLCKNGDCKGHIGVAVRERPDGRHEYQCTSHFLGETLFRHGLQGRFFVCGLDRNDAPQKRKFFLARLPNTRKHPKTVDEALAMLAPKKLPEGTLRQGEWFLVPSPGVKPQKDKIEKATPGYSATVAGVPILSGDSKQMRQALDAGSWELRARINRHRATRMYLNGSVFVSGMLRDAEHGPLKIGDGKTWFKVVRNLADGAWSAGGDVD